MSTCCTGLSKSWWWLLMLFGLALLYLVMLQVKQGMIESDLQARIQQQLTTEGINSSKLTLEQRGRDVLLSGSLATEQERDRVIKLAERVTGVRVVDNGINVPAPVKPILVLAASQRKIVLSGILPFQEQIDGLMQAAVFEYGESNVDNQLTLDNSVAAPAWIDDSKLLFNVLNTVDTVTVTLATGVPFLSAVVYSDSEKTVLHQRVQGLLSMSINERIAVNNTIEPADITAHMMDGTLTLKGKLTSQAQIDAMLSLLSQPLGKEIINNQLMVSNGITPEKGRLTLSGYVDDTTHIKLRLAAKDVMKSTGFTLKDRLLKKTRTSASDMKTEAAEIRNSRNPSIKSVANATIANEINKEAITACQSKLDQAMLGKTIHFASNQSTIKTTSIVLLDQLVNIIAKCKATLSGSEIIISGYTDNKGNDHYNTTLSQQRADVVKNYLKKAGIAHSLLKAKGFGEAQPIASNANEEGRARNRRITFSVVNKQLVSK